MRDLPAAHPPAPVCAFRLLGVPPSEPYDELALVALDTTTGSLTEIRAAAGQAVCAHGGDAFIVTEFPSYWHSTTWGEVIAFHDPSARPQGPAAPAIRSAER